MPHEYEWEDRLAMSSGVTERTHPETIQKLIGPSCVRVERNITNGNDNGIDYWAYLRGGAKLAIDIKAREHGCSKYWKSCPLFGVGVEPELALEIWSVKPEPENFTGQAGWTLSESKETDYILHVFDISDTPERFLLPFQLLRMGFRRNIKEWTRKFRVETQRTSRANGHRWQSECVFVPAVIVIDAITEEMRPSQKTLIVR
jgi:hypothetical protein